MDQYPSASGAEDPSRPPAVQRALADLGQIALDQPMGAFVQQVADLAARALSVQALSVTLIENGRARLAAFTAPVAAALDERQYEAGFGPSLDAAAGGQTIRVDLARGQAGQQGYQVYPDFAAVARRHGVVAVASVAMPAPHRVVGALNLYSTSGAISEDTLVLARRFAAYAAVAVTNAMLVESATRLAAQMQEAMANRAVIEQAKGVLMAAHGCDADAAFARLSTASQSTNTKLHDLAAGVVARVAGDSTR